MVRIIQAVGFVGEDHPSTGGIYGWAPMQGAELEFNDTREGIREKRRAINRAKWHRREARRKAKLKQQVLSSGVSLL